jgi:chromosome segregation ATPase
MNTTSIGKIMVIVITAFSLTFLAISTVVFGTSRDWLTETRDEQKSIDELKKKLGETTKLADEAQKSLEDAKVELADQAKQIGSRLTAIEEENKRDLIQIGDLRTQVAKAQDTARATLDQVEAKRKAIGTLLVEKDAVEKQAGDYKRHRAELTDRIRDVERMLGAATSRRASTK